MELVDFGEMVAVAVFCQAVQGGVDNPAPCCHTQSVASSFQLCTKSSCCWTQGGANTIPSCSLRSRHWQLSCIKIEFGEEPGAAMEPPLPRSLLHFSSFIAFLTHSGSWLPSPHGSTLVPLQPSRDQVAGAAVFHEPPPLSTARAGSAQRDTRNGKFNCSEQRPEPGKGRNVSVLQDWRQHEAPELPLCSTLPRH